MAIRGDERAVAVQVGAILLLGFVLIPVLALGAIIVALALVALARRRLNG
jgi:hypothetical protein